MVEVYARAAKVALKINGKTVGEAAPKNDCVVRFSCTYEDGTVEAVSYDAAGNEIGRTALHTANTETRLCLVPEEETVRPGGLAFVQLRYTDENGTVKPLERGTVTVKSAAEPAGAGQRLCLQRTRLSVRYHRYLFRRSAGRGPCGC